METITLHSWDEFDNQLKQRANFRESRKGLFDGDPANFVFRGQSNAEWSLETTLERSMPKNYSFIEYYKLIREVKSRIEAETQNNWELLELPEYLDWLRGHDFLWSNGLPGVEYLVYLRHHGFPSPLLDWTRDPDVAAYFAFRDILSKAESVAIFVYLEDFGTKGYRGGEPNIKLVDLDIPQEIRHKRQQSTYTICSTEEKGEAYYSGHEELFGANRSNRTPQDMLWKFIIPSSDRSDVIKKLELKNINAYTLFASEDSLIESLFLQSLFK